MTVFSDPSLGFTTRQHAALRSQCRALILPQKSSPQSGSGSGAVNHLAVAALPVLKVQKSLGHIHSR